MSYSYFTIPSLPIVIGIFLMLFVIFSLFLLIKSKTRQLQYVKNDFEQLFDKNPNPMWIYEVHTLKIVLVNDAACISYGYTREEFLSLNLLDLRPEKEHIRLLDNIYNENKEYSNSGEWLHQNKNGEKFYVNIFSHSTFYKNKACRLVTAINIDEKKKVEQDNENIKKALNSATIVSITDLNRVILDVNDKFYSVSGYTKEEVIGQYHSLIVATNHSAEFWQEMQNTIMDGGIWREDIKIRTKSGTHSWIDVSATGVVDNLGKIYKIMFLGYEVNERKNLEEKLLLQNKQLEQIAWQQAHGVRRPVANILGLCNLIRNDLQATETERQEYLAYLYRATEELDEVIHNIMAQTNKV
ncbi:MAG: PAS domain S-box protein [Thermoflexibacter sp.]|nr:PAS domain S-box protein [Thermoflexibacter sp.]